MYCSRCGTRRRPDDVLCGECGADPDAASATGTASTVTLDRRGGIAGLAPAGSTAIGHCPRCRYLGEGLAYFSRGPHLAGLVAATVLTLPVALGAGGFLYYGLRRDHRVCPRCGYGWGRAGERALRTAADAGEADPRGGVVVARAPGERGMRAASAFLLVLACILLVVGVTSLEAVVVGLGLVSAGGAVALRRAANRAREARRQALIASLQTPVLALASRRGGRLTVTQVAATLGWPIRRAEKVLHSLDDGWRVNSEVTAEGVIVYEFRELLLEGDDPWSERG
jgi:hypothetical protein